jgi:PPP family 3-phenylpropionic acid transporter
MDSPNNSRQLTQIGGTFFAIIGGMGAFGPFLGLSLSQRGIPPESIGLLLGMIPVASTTAMPIWALVADRWRLSTRLLQAATLGSLGVGLAIALPSTNLIFLAVCLGLLGVLRGPVSPLLDALTVKALEDSGKSPTDYGKVRLWGSVGFLICGFLASVAAEVFDLPGAPLWVAVGAWFIGLVFVLRLPVTRSAGPVRLGPALRVLARTPGLGWFVAALPFHTVGLNAYDTWYAVHVDSLGLADTWTGAALFTGIAAEIGLMAISARLLAGRPPEVLFAISVAVGGVRWGLCSILTDPLLLTLLQTSHGFVFALFWLSGTEIMRRAAPPEVRASGQALLLVASYGMGPILGSLAASYLVGKHGTSSLFQFAAICSALALLLLAIGRLTKAKVPRGTRSATP